MRSNNLVNFLIEYDRLYGNSDLYGKGLFDMFIRQDSFTKSSQTIFDMYSGYEIKRLQIYRTPINSMIDKFLKVISFGKFNNDQYDKLFHLALIATVQTPQGDKNVVLEKNATINISTSYKTNSDTEVMDVPLQNKQLTIKSLLDNTLSQIGNKRFYLYDAFSTNCQQFIIDILNSNNLNLNNQQITNFVLQPLDKLVKNLGSVGSKVIPSIAKAITDVGAIFGAGEDGFELHSVKIPKTYKLEDAKAKSQEVIKNKSRNFFKESKNYYVFRNIAKRNFKKGSFKSKKSGNIILVFGELK